MRLKRAVFPFLTWSLIGLWACGPQRPTREPEPQSGGAVDTQSALQSIQRQWERWETAAQTEDAEMMASVYAEEAILLPPNSPAVVGRDTMRSLFDSFFRRSDMSYDFEIHEVVVADGWAFRRGSFTMSARRSGNSGPAREQKFIDIWQRQPDGAWRIAWDIWNSSGPPY